MYLKFLPLCYLYYTKLGHAETEDEMVDDSGAQFAFDRKENQSDEEFYAGFTKYYQLPNEQLATDWAVWFYKKIEISVLCGTGE